MDLGYSTEREIRSLEEKTARYHSKYGVYNFFSAFSKALVTMHVDTLISRSTNYSELSKTFGDRI